MRDLCHALQNKTYFNKDALHSKIAQSSCSTMDLKKAISEL